MSINFPTSLDALTNPTASDNTVTISHAGQHSNANDAIEAIETKLGIDSSTNTSSIDYKLKNSASINPGHKHSLLAGISDVAITSPATGNGLFYNSTSGKWENADTSVADASTSVKGVSKLSTTPVSPTNPISVGDNDTRVPTQNENDALVGTSGTAVSSSNKLVDNANTAGTGLLTRNAMTAISIFGTGIDGDITITSGTTTLTRDMYYNNLTLNTGAILNANSYLIFVKGTLTQEGTGKIKNNGGNGGNGTAGSSSTGGTPAGTAGTSTNLGTLPASKAGVVGGVGGNGASGGAGSGVNGLSGMAGIASTNSLFSQQTLSNGYGGDGEAQYGYGPAFGGAIGTAGESTVSLGYPNDLMTIKNFATFLSGTFTQFKGASGNGGAGGGGGGSGDGNSGRYGGGGGAGGGSGGNGGIIVVFANTIIINTGVTLFQAIGGDGGNGGNAGVPNQIGGGGGGGAGSGGNGGYIIIVYRTKSGTITYDVVSGSNGSCGVRTGAGHDGALPSGKITGQKLEIII